MDCPSGFSSPSVHILCLAAATWILRMPYHRVPIDRDRGRFLMMVVRWLKGDGFPTYYADVMMAPGRLFVLALAHLFSARDPFKLRVFYTGYSFLIALAFYGIVYPLFGPFPAFFASLACIAIQNLLVLLPFIANAETLMNLSTILAYGVAMNLGVRQEGWVFLCGCFAGVSILFKQSGALNTALPLALFILIQGLWLPFLAFCMGAAAVLGGLWLLLILRGHPWRAFFLHPEIVRVCFDYVKGGGVHYRFTQRKKVGYYEYYKNTRHFIFLELFWVLFPAALWAMNLRWGGLMGRAPEALLLFWLGGALLGIAGSGELIAFHFIGLAPPLALAATLGTARLMADPSGHLLAFGVIGAFLLFTVLRQIRAYGRYGRKVLENQEIFEISKRCLRLAKWLKKRTKPTDRIFYWTGEPELYYYAGRESPTRFNFWVFPNQHLSTRFNHPGGVKDFHGTMEDLEKVLPRYIAFGSPVLDYHELFHLVLRHYREVEYGDERIRVFRLQDHRLSGKPRPWNPKFTLVVFTKDSFKHLKSTLKTLYEQTNEDFEMIIVDRGSADETVPWVKCLYGVEIMEETRKPIGEIVSEVGRRAKGEYLAVFAAGQMVHVSWTLLVNAHFRMNPQVNILCPVSDHPRAPFSLGESFHPKVRTAEEKAKKQHRVSESLALQERPLDSLFSNFAVYRTSLFQNTDGMTFEGIVGRRGHAVLACDFLVEDDKDLELLSHGETIGDDPDPLEGEDRPGTFPRYGLAPRLEGEVCIPLKGREEEVCVP